VKSGFDESGIQILFYALVQVRIHGFGVRFRRPRWTVQSTPRAPCQPAT
jgi:hypothetical protein